ncbi:hypothetical protein OTU49_013347 [Cherax quadricarinatus]|uniref:NACHT domain-containing protein n=1 Tax=Cherax quadricarinatus TaxID=27406 RepID=A0AAW0VTY3_CHEQU
MNDKQVFNACRLIKAVNICAKYILHKTFLWGNPDKCMIMKLDFTLFMNTPKTSKFLDKTLKQIINKHPDVSEFDVSLLYDSIKSACKKEPPLSDQKWYIENEEIEYYITSILNMRNNVLHGQLAVTDENYKESLNNHRELSTRCLKICGKKYGRDEAEVTKEVKQMNDILEEITTEILLEDDILLYCSDMVKRRMINDSRAKLMEIFQSISYVNPVSCITSDLKLKEDEIFVDIEVTHGQHGGRGQHISYQHLLKLVQTTAPPSFTRTVSQQQDIPTRPCIILVEGVAGSGKTTLVKLVIEEWTQGGQGNISDLDNYELLLWVQCRDPTMTCYQQLLDRLMPEIDIKLKEIHQKLMKLCKILIIIDGLDEDNESSRTLVQSLLQEFKYCSNIAFLCTSRPEKVENFRRTIPAKYTVTHVTLHGISKENLVQFVRLNHPEITKQTGNNRNTEELEKVINLRLHEHLRLPMNLILMIYIWDNDPDQLNLTSVTHTKLYYNIHELCKHKLIHRLTNHQDTETMDDKDLTDNVNIMLMNIYKTALETLSRDQLDLEVNILKNLKRKCKHLCLPYKEVLSAFLCLRPTWTMLGIKERYSAPHKGIQDYFAALYIVNNLINPQYSTPTSASATSASATSATFLSIWREWKQYIKAAISPSPVSIRGVLEESIRSGVVDMNKYQNVLIHVAGLLYLLLDQVPETLAREVVHLLQESGMRTHKQWLNLLDITNICPVIVKEVSQFFNTKDIIYISSIHVKRYSALLPHLSSCEVDITILCDPSDLPELPDLLAALTHHHCTKLALLYHYYHADTTTFSDNLLQLVQSRSQLGCFTGSLTCEGFRLLQECHELWWLFLAVMTDHHAASLLPQLHHTVTSTLHQLEWLGVKVSAAAVSVAAVTSLPSTKTVMLDLTDLSDDLVSHACDLAKELQPAGGLGSEVQKSRKIFA